MSRSVEFSTAAANRLADDRAVIEIRLREGVRAEIGAPARLIQAMEHSLLGGGKRLRPVLLLWCHDACGGRRRNDALTAGIAREMIHTYSLIHDDLPAMDDDVLRRGRPTCHVAYDEATAILAGDALLTRAFGLLSRVPDHGAALVGVLADAAGAAGMVGGQQEDLDAEGVELTHELVGRIHLGKTARLIAAPLVMGAMLAGADRDTIRGVEQAGLRLGLAFQAADDVLDATAGTEILGKTAGKDAASAKPTWVRLEGLDPARDRARRYGAEGIEGLRTHLVAGSHSDDLLGLCRSLWERSC